MPQNKTLKDMMRKCNRFKQYSSYNTIDQSERSDYLYGDYAITQAVQEQIAAEAAVLSLQALQWLTLFLRMYQLVHIIRWSLGADTPSKNVDIQSVSEELAMLRENIPQVNLH
jgi:hypothetical protein